LEQFFYALRDTAGLSLLDMSQASQANIGFITGLGHRIYAEDVLSILYNEFGSGDFYANQSDTERGRAILDQCLGFPTGHFDGALVWDTLQYLAPPMLQTAVDRLYDVMRPNAYMLAFFSAEDRTPTVPHYAYRISDEATLKLTLRAKLKPAQFFTSRSLERLFGRFQNVKFFLTRDHLREVLVKR
jgi:hypothetical protein